MNLSHDIDDDLMREMMGDADDDGFDDNGFDDDVADEPRPRKPDSLEALLLVEKLLGAAMRSPVVLDRLKIAGVSAAEFERVQHGDILEAMLAVEKKHGRVEQTLISVYLREKKEWLPKDVKQWINAAADAGAVLDDDSISLAIERIRYAAGIRRFHDLGNKLFDDLRARARPITEIAGDMSRGMEAIIAGTTTRNTSINGRQLMKKIRASREQDRRPFIRVPTGIGPLDDMMRGGYRTGRLFVYAADMGQGKTTFLAHMVMAALRAGHRVFVCTFESADVEIGEILIEMRAGVRYLDAKTRDEHTALAEAEAWLSECDDLILECVESITVEEYVARLQYEKRAFDAVNADNDRAFVAFMDYFQDVDRSTKYSRDDLNFAHISKSLRRAAARYDVAQVVLSQIGEPPTQAIAKQVQLIGPVPVQIAYTKQLGKDAAYIAMGDRPAEDDDPIKQNTTRVKLMKNRPDKLLGRAHMLYDRRTTRLQPCDAAGRVASPTLFDGNGRGGVDFDKLRAQRQTAVAVDVDDDGFGPRGG